MIQDYPCSYKNSAGVRRDVTENMDLTFPDAYRSAETIAQLAAAVQDADNAPYCILPFGHTLEGGDMGGNVNWGDAYTGPRAGAPICKTLDEVFALPDADPAKGDLAECIKAIRILKEQGRAVLYEVTGPFTLLNVLVDPTVVFKALRKDPDRLFELFERIGEMEIRVAQAVVEAGADVISYGDSAATLTILGPKMMTLVTERFTASFLKKLDAALPAQAMITLCPKTARALEGLEMASWREIPMEEDWGYGESLLKMAGKARFSGQFCMKETGKRNADHTFRELVLK